MRPDTNPFNEIFYATIKLISGEEVFAKVCAILNENEDILLILDHPVIVETMFVPNINAPIAKINPWLSLSNQTSFVISIDKIITISEVTDNMYISMHTRYIRDKERTTNKTKPTSNMGYVGSVSEAIETLERLYNSESSNNPKE